MEEGCAEDDEEEADGEDLNNISVDAIWEEGFPRAYEGERDDGLETCRRHGGRLAAGGGRVPRVFLLQGQVGSMRPSIYKGYRGCIEESEG